MLGTASQKGTGESKRGRRGTLKAGASLGPGGEKSEAGAARIGSSSRLGHQAATGSVRTNQTNMKES